MLRFIDIIFYLEVPAYRVVCHWLTITLVGSIELFSTVKIFNSVPSFTNIMDLKFDAMSVDTKLAQEFVANHKVLSEYIETGTQQEATIYPTFEERPNRAGVSRMLAELTVILRNNTNLIAQLEYLIRQVPLEDTLVQINLLVQQMSYVAGLSEEEHLSQSSIIDAIVMDNDSPLLMLGYVAKICRHQSSCYLFAADASAPVCLLFTELCHKVGLPLFTELRPSELIETGDYEVPTGSVAVVSEHSDIDSAVHALLTSSRRVPWSLRNIFVQESVYEQFKDALYWKCNVNKKPGVVKFKNTLPDTVEYDGRVFRIDPVGSSQQQPAAVSVEAYRTRKELKTLLSQYRAHYVSLWASDVAEINEITYSIHSPVVWVNNFGDFRGPTKASEAVYSQGITAWPLLKHVKSHDAVKLKQSWLSLSQEARRDMLSKALDECISAESANDNYKSLKKHLLKIERGQDAFADVGKDYICLGFTAPVNQWSVISEDGLTVEHFESLLHGQGLLLRTYSFSCKNYLDILTKAGAPLIYAEQPVTADVPREFSDGTVNTRVIWTSTGTVFAN